MNTNKNNNNEYLSWENVLERLETMMMSENVIDLMDEDGVVEDGDNEEYYVSAEEFSDVTGDDFGDDNCHDDSEIVSTADSGGQMNVLERAIVLYGEFYSSHLHLLQGGLSGVGATGGVGATALPRPISFTLVPWLPDVLPQMRFINRLTQAISVDNIDAIISRQSDLQGPVWILDDLRQRYTTIYGMLQSLNYSGTNFRVKLINYYATNVMICSFHPLVPFSLGITSVTLSASVDNFIPVCTIQEAIATFRMSSHRINERRRVHRSVEISDIFHCWRGGLLRVTRALIEMAPTASILRCYACGNLFDLEVLTWPVVGLCGETICYGCCLDEAIHIKETKVFCTNRCMRYRHRTIDTYCVDIDSPIFNIGLIRTLVRIYLLSTSSN